MSNTLAGVSLEQVSEQTLDLLSDNFWMFSLFARNFSEDIRERGDRTVTRVPSSVTVKDFTAGYGANDVVSQEIEIELANHRGFSMAFSEMEMAKAKSPTILERTFIRPAIDATARAVADSLLALITPSNFSASQVRTQANFDSDDLADAAATLTNNKAPRGLRNLMIGPGYASSLAKDSAIMDASGYGTAGPLQDGELGAVHGFGIAEYQGIPSTNNLEGFYCHPSALCIAARQIGKPLYGNVEVIDSIEPRTGLPIQCRKFYHPTQGKYYLTVGILYGVQVGNQDALIRLTNQ